MFIETPILIIIVLYVVYVTNSHVKKINELQDELSDLKHPNKMDIDYENRYEDY